MTITIVKDDHIVRRSRNLRGLITHAFEAGVDMVNVFKTRDGANVAVVFGDGAECRTRFADYSVAVDFFSSRAKRWGICAHDCTESFWHAN